jgi:hypothetical protein
MTLSKTLILHFAQLGKSRLRDLDREGEAHRLKFPIRPMSSARTTSGFFFTLKTFTGKNGLGCNIRKIQNQRYLIHYNALEFSIKFEFLV